MAKMTFHRNWDFDQGNKQVDMNAVRDDDDLRTLLYSAAQLVRIDQVDPTVLVLITGDLIQPDPVDSSVLVVTF